MSGGSGERPLRLAILSESPADETAISVLIEGVLGGPFARVGAGFRARGWPNVAQVLPAVLRHLHFRTNADGLVVVVDCDDAVVHTDDHDRPGYFHPRCRMCELRMVFRRTLKRFPPAQGRERVLRGIGIAVPAVEAWYLAGNDAVSEFAWLDGERHGVRPYTRPELKRRVYGTERPSLEHETELALNACRRLRRDLRRLRNDFPSFDALARDIEAMRAPGGH